MIIDPTIVLSVVVSISNNNVILTMKMMLMSNINSYSLVLHFV